MKSMISTDDFRFKIGDAIFVVETYPTGFYRVNKLFISSLGVDMDGIFYEGQDKNGIAGHYREKDVFSTEEEARGAFFDRRFRELEKNIADIKDDLRHLKMQIEEAKNEQNQTN